MRMGRKWREVMVVCESRDNDMDEMGMYNSICDKRFTHLEERFDKRHTTIEGKVDKVIVLLQGNGKQGIKDMALNNKRWIQRVMWGLGVLFIAVVTAIAKGHFQAHP